MWRRTGALTLVCLLSHAVSAAQPAERGATQGEAADASGTSDRLIQQGIQLRREKRDAEALERFERAHRLVASPRALAQIGLAELALSRFDVAEAHLREALNADDDWVRRNRATLERSLNAAGAHLGSVTVRTNVEDAELWINGTRVGTMPLGPQRVLAGNVLVELRRRSGERADRALTLAAGAAHHVQVDFVRVRSTSRTPVAPSRRSRRAPARGDSIDATSSTAPTVAWMLMATGAVLLTEGVVAHVLRENLVSRYNERECFDAEPTQPERCGAVRGKAETARTLAIAGYVGAGVAFGAAGVLFAMPSPRRPQAGVGSGAQLFYSRPF
jgi:hypothetical protein